MTEYMTVDSPDAFLDLEKRSQEEYEKCFTTKSVECPKCHGYGRWHLRLNAYGSGRHFDASCSQCNGWGFVDADSTDATCIHNDKELSQQECRDLDIGHWGMCWHVYCCTKCGRIRSVDSSD